MATAASNHLRADVDVIESFLRTSLGTGIHLAAITPDGPVSFYHFCDNATQAATWAAAENERGRGLYWTVNRVRDGFHGKPEKGDITEARFVHTDVDPRKDGAPFDKVAELHKLCAARSEPSFVIDSGGGLQAFWRLENPAANLPAIEAINMGVADAFDADHCHNIDRLMRLPGTVNWPNKKKAAKGRTPAAASIVIDDHGTFHDAADLALAFPRVAKAVDDRGKADVSGPYALLTADDLALAPMHPLRSLIDHPQGRDRSGDALACAGRMARDSYSDAQIMGVLMNAANAVHAHIGDQRDPRYQALRCIEVARSGPSAVHGASVAANIGIPMSGAAAGIPATELPKLLRLINPAEWLSAPRTAALTMAALLTRFEASIDDESRDELIYLGGFCIRLADELDRPVQEIPTHG